MGDFETARARREPGVHLSTLPSHPSPAEPFGRYTIDAAMKYCDTITVGRVVPNAPRRAEDSPPYQCCLTTYHCRSNKTTCRDPQGEMMCLRSAKIAATNDRHFSVTVKPREAIFKPNRKHFISVA